MVDARRAIELLYDSTCDILELQSYQKPNKSTGHREINVVENEACRLSFSNIVSTNTGVAAGLNQSVKLFIRPDLEIRPGSKVVVTNKHGQSTAYKSSGQPAVYTGHQEVMLDLFEEWA